jgi:hypothetical protein
LTRLTTIRVPPTGTEQVTGARAVRGRRYAAAVAERRRPPAVDSRPIGQTASARHAGYAFELKRRLEAAVEGDPERLRAVARARRNKRGPRA